MLENKISDKRKIILTDNEKKLKIIVQNLCHPKDIKYELTEFYSAQNNGTEKQCYQT